MIHPPTRILLVDDQPANLVSLEATLADERYEIYKARSGSEGLRMLLKHDFAVVLLDVQMPEMDGFEVARLMRSSKRTAGTPIIFVTGMGDAREQIFSGYEAGAVDYLVKPLDPAVVRAKVAIFRELYEQRRLLERQAAELTAHVAQLKETRRVLEEKSSALERSETDLRRLNGELEQRVAARTRELELANQQLEAFVYSASHNLRTPLRSIVSFVTILLEDAQPVLAGEDLEMLERVARSAKDMWQLLAALLRLSRLSSQPIEHDEVNLPAMAERVVVGLRAGDPERNVELILPENAPPVRGDYSMVQLLLTVLLENAWKYTAREEVAHIELGCDAEQDPPVWFVRDDGAGFDMSLAGRIFTPFQRFHSPTDFEGCGLGLATAHQVVTLHGGEITAEAHVGEGATFRFTLPD